MIEDELTAFRKKVKKKEKRICFIDNDGNVHYDVVRQIIKALPDIKGILQGVTYD